MGTMVTMVTKLTPTILESFLKKKYGSKNITFMDDMKNSPAVIIDFLGKPQTNLSVSSITSKKGAVFGKQRY